MTVLQYKLEVEVGICADGERSKAFWFSEGQTRVAIIGFIGSPRRVNTGDPAYRIVK